MRQLPFKVCAPAVTQAAQASSKWRWLALACALLALPATAAERERIVPSAAVLVAGLENSARADASAAPNPCANGGAQAALDECSYEGFLKASAVMSAQLRQVEAALKPGQRTTWRRVQKAWMTYRTQACHFESSQLADGGARARVQWQCAARMTRERSAELARLANCRDGELACPARGRTGKAP